MRSHGPLLPAAALTTSRAGCRAHCRVVRVAALDTNHDGEISEEEFIAGFDKFKTIRDGGSFAFKSGPVQQWGFQKWKLDRWLEFDGRRVALGDFSHALLGVLDGIAAPASQALSCLACGDAEGYVARMEPCEALSRIRRKLSLPITCAKVTPKSCAPRSATIT